MEKGFLKGLIAGCLLIGYGILNAGDWKSGSVPLSDLVLVLPDSSDGVKRFAASELKKHLDLISGQDIKIVQEKSLQKDKYPIFVGIRFPEDKNAFSAEEARYSVVPAGIYIYGDDKVGSNKKTDFETAVNEWSNRSGTLFAAYFFLENEFGIKWLEPGDKGIVYKSTKNFAPADKKFSWTPSLTQRHIRPVVYPAKANAEPEEKLKNIPAWLKDAKKRRAEMGLPPDFVFTESEGIKRTADDKIWLKRMKMGRSVQLSYGHAFTNWWNKYGASHPEFFALDIRNKKREPVLAQGGPERIKMCVSNPELHKEIVSQWLLKKSPYLNACENDSAGYCSCPACLALDVKMKDREFGSYMTDRYIWFANHLLKLAREKNPDAKVVMYAYEDFLIPPSREKVSSGIILGAVPENLTTEKDDLEKFYAGWKKVGASEFFMRPNDMNIETVMPMGLEKKLFDGFKIGVENGIFGTDYDRHGSSWGVSGMANYILARAHSYPDRPFAYWEEEYCSAYGAAKDDIKEYYQYWRKNIWEKRIYPERDLIMKAGRYGNFRRGLMWKLAEYYKTEDFDETDRILQRASSRNLSNNEREQLSRLILANQHSRLTYDAITVGTRGDKNSSLDKINAARNLLKFRNENALKLQMDWPLLFNLEKDYGDLTGIIMLQQFQGKLKPVLQMPLTWRFKTDPDNAGLNEKWQNKDWKEISTSWEKIRIGVPWTKQKDVSGVSDNLKKLTANYKGVAWYSTILSIDEKLRQSKVYLTFGAVDKSCWIYVNGREVGRHVYTEADDWKMPFSIRIDEGFSQEKVQLITIRTDSGNLGGIWKPVFLAVENE